MTTSINVTDLGKLAKLSCAVVHGIDFPELGDNAKAKQELLGEVDRLDQQYANNAMLFDLRAAVCSFPVQKQTIYTLTHDILRKVRGTDKVTGLASAARVSAPVAPVVTLPRQSAFALHS